MEKLEAVNMMLRRLGESTVTSLDVPYPTVSIALPALEEARTGLLLSEWYFNKFEWRNLLPNQFGQVEVPTEVLMLYPEDPERFVFAGKYVRDARTGQHVDTAVLCKIVVDVPFEELPVQAQLYCVYQAAHSVYVQDFGMDDTAQVIQQEAMGAYVILSAQHTRHRKYNTRTRRNWQRMLGGLRN